MSTAQNNVSVERADRILAPIGAAVAIKQPSECPTKVRGSICAKGTRSLDASKASSHSQNATP